MGGTFAHGTCMGIWVTTRFSALYVNNNIDVDHDHECDTSTVHVALKCFELFLLLLHNPFTAMRFSTPVSLFTLAVLVAADQASDVISLTAQTFESTVNAEAITLVEFFAPWYSLITSWTFSLLTRRYRCGHCKALAPHYEEAATTLKEKNIKLAKIDCVDEADLCQSHGVQGYPCVPFILYSQNMFNGLVIQNLEGLSTRCAHRVPWPKESWRYRQLYDQVS